MTLASLPSLFERDAIDLPLPGQRIIGLSKLARVVESGACTVTSALHGRVRDDLRTRQEFLSLTGASRV